MTWDEASAEDILADIQSSVAVFSEYNPSETYVVVLPQWVIDRYGGLAEAQAAADRLFRYPVTVKEQDPFPRETP